MVTTHEQESQFQPAKPNLQMSLDLAPPTAFPFSGEGIILLAPQASTKEIIPEASLPVTH